jgi:hypothetical protein
MHVSNKQLSTSPTSRIVNSVYLQTLHDLVHFTKLSLAIMTSYIDFSQPSLWGEYLETPRCLQKR